MNMIAQHPQHKIAYGAKELHKAIGKNTFRGLAGALNVFMILGLLLFILHISDTTDTLQKLTAPFARTTTAINLPMPVQAQSAPSLASPPAVQKLLIPGTLSRAGTPVAVPQTMLPIDAGEFNSLLQQVAANGNGSNIDFSPDNVPTSDNRNASSVLIDQKPAEPHPYDDVNVVEKEPYINIADIQKKVVYPPLAIRAGVEGRVFIRVLVGQDGKPVKSIIEHTDSPLLQEAAQKAVMSVEFLPAIQNGNPVPCWISIPVTFRLR